MLVRILIVTEHYLPGYKAGGPIRTLASVTEFLGDEFAFFVLTSDRDLNSSAPYSDIEPGVWQTVDKAQVLYLRPAEKGWRCWRNWLKALEYDVIYLNGYFPRLTIKTLVLRWLRLIPSRPVILAPRGEFSAGALNLKRVKKALYLTLSRWVNLYSDVIWQASSVYERQDIINVLKSPGLQIVVAPNLVYSGHLSHITTTPKETNSVKVVFLSRISRKKNLDYALRILLQLHGDIVFNIYGPLEDTAYWQECQTLIAQMPQNIQVNYLGEVMPEQVIEVLGKYHLFFFPTRGENFGHVISEALRAGCPVLISDQTPWQGLEEQKAGWVIPLPNPERFQTVVETLLRMDNDTFQEYSQSARRYGEQAANDPAMLEANRTLFLTALTKHT